jgi:hypothetical protein
VKTNGLIDEARPEPCCEESAQALAAVAQGTKEEAINTALRQFEER